MRDTLMFNPYSVTYNIFCISSNILLFLQAVNTEIFNKLIIFGKYRKSHECVKTL